MERSQYDEIHEHHEIKLGSLMGAATVYWVLAGRKLVMKAGVFCCNLELFLMYFCQKVVCVYICGIVHGVLESKKSREDEKKIEKWLSWKIEKNKTFVE